MGKAPGNVARKKLSLIYNEFIEAYKETVDKTGDFFPSLFLIYSENSKTKNDPLFFPLNVRLLHNDKSLDFMLNAVVKSFPSSRFTLEMMMYANKAESEVTGEEIILFAARDAAGNTIHSAMEQDKKSVNTKMVMKNPPDSPFHKWMPPAKAGIGISTSDAFLKFLAVKYAVASSTKLLEME